jgi:hypothetical protein
MAGDFNAKHVDSNSRMTTVRGKLLRDYADRHSRFIQGPDSPTTVSYNPSAAPDILDIAVTKNLRTPVHLTTCSALSSDHLPILIDTTCRSSFLNPADRPDFKLTVWSKFQTCLDNVIPFNTETADEASIDACVECLTSAISGALEVTTPKSRPRADLRPSIPARIQDVIRLKNRLRRQWQLTRDTELKAEANRFLRSVTLQLQEWRNVQWSDTLEALHPEDQSLWRMSKRVMRVTTTTAPLLTPGTAASPKCLYTFAHLGTVTMPLSVQIPDSLPTKLFPPIYVW